MKLIVGLGNTGASYSLTRHNLGFMVVDALAENSHFKKSDLSLVQKINTQGQSVLLAKPQTQMNLSGKAVQQLLSYYKIDVKDLLVIHDDLDLDLSQMKFQNGRGAGGHNGVKDIHECLGHSDYFRLKLGIGHPSRMKLNIPVDHYVLSSFSKEELGALEKLLIKSTEAVRHFILNGGESARNTYNKKTESESS